MDLAVFQATSRAGVKILLSGNDGDTTVSYGYELLTELARQGRWIRLFKEAKALAVRHNSPDRVWRLLWVLGLRPLLPGRALRLWQRLRYGCRPAWGESVPIRPEFARRVALEDRMRALKAQPSVQGNARMEHIRALQGGLLSYALNILDKTAAKCSIELRYPFFDRRLMSFCVSVPATQKLQNGLGRAIMRRALKGVLPPEIELRVHKGSMESNFQTKLLALDRTRLDQLFDGDAQFVEPYIDLEKLRQFYVQYLAAPRKATREALALFQVGCLASWLRRAQLAP
jgi:asparagine synthase (glutamine-hydrolysing)